MNAPIHPSVAAARQHWRSREYTADGHLACEPCDQRAPHGTPSGYSGWRCRCDVCRKAHSAYNIQRASQNGNRAAYMRDWKERHPVSSMLTRARMHARRKGVQFALTQADIEIPAECPVCGVVLSRRNRGICPQSPSLDRLIPALGYTPGNVWVLCQECNTRKSNMSVAFLRHLADAIEKRLAQGGQ